MPTEDYPMINNLTRIYYFPLYILLYIINQIEFVTSLKFMFTRMTIMCESSSTRLKVSTFGFQIVIEWMTIGRDSKEIVRFQAIYTVGKNFNR